MIRLVLTCLVFIWSSVGLLACSASEDVRSESLYAQENDEILGVLDGKLDNVFLVRIFGGVVPFPNRYILQLGASDVAGKVYLSSSAFDTNYTKKLEGGADITRAKGVVTLGRYFDYLENIEKEKEIGRTEAKPIKIITEKRYGLDVEKKYYSIYGEKAVLYFVTDGRQYLVIKDDNPSASTKKSFHLTLSKVMLASECCTLVDTLDSQGRNRCSV